MKPDHVELLSKEVFVSELSSDLASILRTVQAEAELLSDHHAHNLGTAQRLSHLWRQYGDLVMRLIQVRSLAEDEVTFFKDTRDGTCYWKWAKTPWPEPASSPSGGPSMGGSAVGGPRGPDLQGRGQGGTYL